jgi:hypothetical protein
MTLAQFKQRTGSYAPGFLMLGVLAVLTLVLLRVLMARGEQWRTSWRSIDATERAESAKRAAA